MGEANIPDTSIDDLFAEPWQVHEDDWILDLHEGIVDSQRVFRIVDCFAFADYWRTGLLRVSRADRFDDRNEGVERLFSQLVISRPGTCVGMGWTDPHSAIAAHERTLASTFVSSWTRTSDSVAMWSLYSPTRLGVCIETTMGALRRAALSHAKASCLGGISEENVGQKQTICTSAMLSPVTYKSLVQVRMRAERIVRAYERLFARYARLGKKIPSAFEMTIPQLLREHKREGAVRFPSFTLKDESFSHEQEVRLKFEFGAEVVHERDLELHARTSGDRASRRTVRDILRAWANAAASDTNEFLWLPLPTEEVQSVALDPRMASHHSAFWSEWFRVNAVPQRNSEAFGYVVERLSVFPLK